MATNQLSMPDLRDITQNEELQNNRLFKTRSVAQIHEMIEEMRDDDDEKSKDAFSSQIKLKTKKRRLLKHKSKVSDMESPRNEGKKEKKSIKQHIKGLFTRKRIKNSYNLPTPQGENSLNSRNTLRKIVVKEKNKNTTKDHDSITENPVEDRAITSCERTCECECIKQLERRLLQVENEKSAMEMEMMKTIETQNKVISEMTDTLTEFAQNARYVKMSRCQNVQVGFGVCDQKEILEPVRMILDGLCKNSEEVKRTGKNILEKVVEMENASSKDRSQQENDMKYLRERLEQLLAPLEDDSSENADDSFIQDDYCAPRVSMFSSQQSLSGSRNCVVWGPSDVISDVSCCQHEILKLLANMDARLKSAERNTGRFYGLDNIIYKLHTLLIDFGKLECERSFAHQTKV